MTGSLDEANTGFLLDAPDSTTTNFYLLLGDNAYGFSSSSSDFDAYALHLDVGSNYTIISNNNSPFGGGPSTTFGLFNRNGSLVGTPTNFGAYWGYTFTATDTLYFVDTHTPGGVSYYGLRVENNSVTEANGIGETIAPGGTYSAALDYTSDSDHFLFTGYVGRSYRIEVNTAIPNLFLKVTNLVDYRDVSIVGGGGSYFFTPSVLGPYELTISSNSFITVGPYSFSTVIYPSINTSDFDGDLASDILWQNDSGQAAIWIMNGTNPSSGGPVGGNPGPTWHIVGAGDFNKDRKADILWQDDSGQAAIWTMNGTNLLAGGPVGGNPGPTWHIKGTADFNGDDRSDILWQNDSGQAAIWMTDGTSVLAGGPVGGNPGPSWHAVGAGDFSGDNKADILWQNDSGQVAIWLMDGTSFVSVAPLSGNPGPSWHVKGTGDFNGDRIADILWQNDSGQAAIWIMNGNAILADGGPVGGNPGPSWHAISTSDINNDGRSDIVWQNDSGQVAAWLMKGTTMIAAVNLGSNPGSSWHMIALSADTG